MKAWLAESGLDGRYLLVWLAFLFPPYLLSAFMPIAGWKGLPLLFIGAYLIGVIVGFPVWSLVFRGARKSECSERLSALIASWGAVLFVSIAYSASQQMMEGRFSGQDFVQMSVGIGLYGIVVMSVAVPWLFRTKRVSVPGGRNERVQRNDASNV